MVDGLTGTVVDIKAHAQVFKVLFHGCMVFVDDGAGRSTFLGGLDGDGGAMLITATDKHYISFLRPQVTGIDVSRNISTRQVSNVLEAIGVGEGGSNQIAFGHGHFRKK